MTEVIIPARSDQAGIFNFHDFTRFYPKIASFCPNID